MVARGSYPTFRPLARATQDWGISVRGRPSCLAVSRRDEENQAEQERLTISPYFSIDKTALPPLVTWGRRTSAAPDGGLGVMDREGIPRARQPSASFAHRQYAGAVRDSDYDASSAACSPGRAAYLLSRPWLFWQTQCPRLGRCYSKLLEDLVLVKSQPRLCLSLPHDR